MIKITGFALTALVIVGLVLTVVRAAISGESFYGVNYKGLPLGTYSTLACLVLATIIVLVTGLMKVLATLGRRSPVSKHAK